jgi:PAS domain S-box-containing protein
VRGRTRRRWRRRFMSPTIRRTSAVAFGLVAAMLLVMSTLSYRTARRSADANQSVAHTYQVLNALERVLTAMVDAETGTRGFSNTGASRYLEPFERSSADVRSRVDTVAMLTADNPAQQRHLTDLRIEVTETMRLLQDIVSRAQSREPIPLDLRDREKARMDAVRATLQQMRVEEQQLMQQRSDNAASAEAITQALIVALIAVAFGVLAVSFLFVDRRAVQLRQANESLTERVRDRTAELETALAAEQTARRQAQHAQERFQRLVEAAPTAIVAVDRRGTLVFVNALAEKLFGYTRHELVGKPVDMLVPERFRGNHSHYRAEFSDAPQARPMGAGRDLYGVRKNGSEVPIEIGLNPVDLEGETLVISSIVDISERKLLLDSERQARADADAANRSKDVFLARVSHELRTPLNALMGWARMLLDGKVSPDRMSHGIAAIDRNGDVLKKLVEDLVDMSRITTGKLQIDRHPLDIAAVVRESVTMLEPAATAKHISVETNINAGPITVDGDATRLRQVLWNLLSNAIKFTLPNGTVAVSLRLSNGNVDISVADTGQGIAADFLPHVFEPFSQADGGGQRGLGLGLAIVYQLVKVHDGHINVSSPGIGAGTTFTVTLPVVRVPESV